jgi:alpha-galactosidase
MKIAKRNPFSGAPIIHTPTIFGIFTGKEFIYRIPVTGERPIKTEVENLPDGIFINDGILFGKTEKDSEFDIEIIAENNRGKTRKILKIKSAFDCINLTPLMGYTTWNAYDSRVAQNDVERDTKLLISSGIADYGYSYVSIDSGWQSEYDLEPHGVLVLRVKL